MIRNRGEVMRFRNPGLFVALVLAVSFAGCSTKPKSPDRDGLVAQLQQEAEALKAENQNQDTSLGVRAEWAIQSVDVVEQPDNPEMMEMRRKWYEKHLPLGLRAKVLIEEAGEVVGLCQYIPIEHSGFVGEGLMSILCMWVHGYEHGVGVRQGRGLGRLMLEAIEADARESGRKGITAWGKDFPYWNPISFYEHMGYERVDQDGQAVLVWKAFTHDAKPPRFHQPKKTLPVATDRVSVAGFYHGWCLGACEQAPMMMVDDDYPPATLELPGFDLRAEFWVEGAGGEYGTDTNDAGAGMLI